MKKIFLLLAATTYLVSCNKDKKDENFFVGPEVSVHHGKAWSWIQLEKNGAPAQLGLTINQAALNTVPTGDEHPGHGHEHEDNFIVPMHEKARTNSPFKFIMLNWNRNGHEPAGTYDVPHFDMHFYMTELNDVLNYTDPAKLDADPAAGYIPANHVGVHPLPQMGKHWIDVTSPELSGAPFTQTFIYGSYDSKVVFYEPMITLDFLKNTTSFERPLPQPTKFEKAGYYPTKMKVVKQNGATNIILDGFIYRQAS